MNKLAEKLAPMYYKKIYIEKVMTLDDVPVVYRDALEAYRQKQEQK